MTFAHLTGGGGLFDGLAHPVFGIDHLIAIVVVGTLAYLLRDRLAWFTLPATFVGAMALGGTLGVLGVTTGSTELFVALSVVLLGVVLLALTGVVEARALAGLVALAALFHGLAHGGEVPERRQPGALRGRLPAGHRRPAPRGRGPRARRGPLPHRAGPRRRRRGRRRPGARQRRLNQAAMTVAEPATLTSPSWLASEASTSTRRRPSSSRLAVTTTDVVRISPGQVCLVKRTL